MAALATERWLAEKNLAKTIVRETPEPEKKLNTSDFNEEEVNEDTFDANSEWQKGSYALRKLYHESKKTYLSNF
jgi:thioredoxin reductase (NADPH)